MSNISSTIPTRVRELRIERRWTQQMLADRANTTFATISKLERSHRQLSLEWIERLATAFEITTSELLSGDKSLPVVRQIPLIGRIAAGAWSEAVMSPLGYVAAVDTGARTFALQADGDSMDQIIAPGGYAIVDPDDGDLRDGRVYAIMNNDGETTIKRYRADPSRLEPCSSNPNHRPISLGREVFTVIGRVTAAVAPL